MPRIRAENVVAHRELMQGRVLDAFGELLAEVGYSDLTLSRVAERAGMARNTIYNYAADKEGLLMAFVARAVDRFVADVRAELAELPDARSRLRALVRRQMHQFLAEPGAGSDGGMLDGAMLGPAGHGDLTTRFQPLHALLAELIGEGIEAGAFRPVDVDLVVPMAFAVLGAERLPVGQGHHDPDDAAERATDFLLHALTA